MDVYSSFINNNPNLETIQMSELCKLWLVNQTVVYPCCERGVGLAISKGIMREPCVVEMLCVLTESASASWVTHFQC